MTNRRFRWYWFPRVNFAVTFTLLTLYPVLSDVLAQEGQ